MKTKFKKAISVLLASVMLLSMVPLAENTGIDFGSLFSLKAEALETSGQCGDNVYWNFDESEGLLTINGTGDMWNWESSESPFYDNESIEEIVIENGVASISDYAFQGCTWLDIIRIPGSVTRIGTHAICGQYYISVYYYGTEEQFDNICSGSSIISNGEISIHYTLERKCGPGVTYIHEEYGSHLDLFTISGTGDMYDYGASFRSPFSSYYPETRVIIEDGVTSIGNSAFHFIESISIPDSVTSIGDYAFSGSTDLRYVEIPDSVTEIGDSAFSDCYSLSEIKLGSGVRSIGDFAFYESGLTSISIPDGVTSIGEDAFALCYDLEEIRIPDSVTSIGSEAFFWSGIKDVYYSGTEEQWNNISFGDYNSELLNANIHYNEDLKNPTVTVQYITKAMTANQTIIFTLSDNTAIDGYYWGTDAEYNNNTYTQLTNRTSDLNVMKAITSPGTYYLTVKDTNNNISSYDIAFYLTKLNPGGGSVATESVLTADIESFILPTPVKIGFTCLGWAKSSSATVPQYHCGDSFEPDSSDELFAVWELKKDYTFGADTYSFYNYTDADSLTGHCFGMSVTSSAYYIGALDISVAGIADGQTLYDLEETDAVKVPICYYQNVQGACAKEAIVAGGTAFFARENDTAADWTEIINYVKNGEYDNKGLLQVGFRGKTRNRYREIVPYTHAVNFLYYQKVNGQDRIYVYDNAYPNNKVFFCKNGESNIVRIIETVGENGEIKEIIPGKGEIIDSYIALRDMSKYFTAAKKYNKYRSFYAEKGTVTINEASAEYLMECGNEENEYVMFEIPEGTEQVTIVPLVDNAEFEYAGVTYSFGDISGGIVGIFTLSDSDDENPPTDDQFKPQPIAVRKVHVSDTNVKFGGKKILNTNITADYGVKYTVKYESFNTSVAEIDSDGTVHGIRSGEAEIKCTVRDEYGNTVIDTCKVTVGDSFIQHIFRVIFSRIFGEKFTYKIINYFISKLQ